jgi:CRP-like cAMP-binding protein
MHATGSASFRERLFRALSEATTSTTSSVFESHISIYNAGDRADRVYLLTSGRVKLVTMSPLGKECLLAILTAGHIFGELCLDAARSRRFETARTMSRTVVKAMPVPAFHAWLCREELQGAFVQYLIDRVVQQQQVITSLVTVDCQRRLGELLLLLARTLGTPDSRSVRIDARISHEELSQMVGTTRPRVTTFINRFRSLGLIELGPRRQMIVREAQLAAHLDSLG